MRLWAPAPMCHNRVEFHLYKFILLLFLLLQQGVSYRVSRSSCDNRFLSNIKSDCNSISNSDEKAWCKVSTDEKAWSKASTDEKAWGKVRSCVS